MVAILLYIAESLGPLNGGSPDKNIYNITPALQISHYSV
jgi:hypothetical protein